MNVSLFTVRHVFVEFVEGMESEIQNPESGMRNSQPFSFCYLWKKSFRIYNIFFRLRIEMLNVLYIPEALRHNNIMPGLLPG